MNKINISFAFTLLVILMPYAGQGFVAYIAAIILILTKINSLLKLNKGFFLFFIITSIIYIIKSFYPNADLLIRYWQVYFGFLIFYVFYSSRKELVEIEIIAILFSTAVIIEAVLINTFIPTSVMLNIPHSDGVMIEGHYTNYFGFYQRPYGPCANPSMTSTLLVVLYTIIEQKKTRWFIFIAVILSASTTGYMLLALAYLLANPLRLRTVFYFVVVISLAAIFSASDEYFSYRISPAYLLTIAEYTIDQFLTHLSPENYSTLIGSNYLVDGEPVFQTDNGWAPLFFTNGLIITVMYLLTPLWKNSIENKVPYLIFLIGAIHYPAVFSLPGQLIFALLLCNRIKALNLINNKIIQNKRRL